MNVQQSNRTAYTSPARSSTPHLRAPQGKQPGILSRIGKAVGEILNGPQVIQKQNSTTGMDRFQMRGTNYQVAIQEDLKKLTYHGTQGRSALSHLDGQMVAWMNQEIIGSSGPTASAPSRPAAPQSARPAGRRA